ncbi:uncharacterized protein B0I36DRAFT_88440 [Microdochium trichocladiopsis]|uniref:Uncharacterized protein n=1 Tax=Microdochium trichocladiopsis TaxID=1682393 RepID=A0A9P8YBA8_9PEZI|nr:uncharacterized protein B0I36DRAFT_88440 [Microdochium trichocladiopsis]KAH7035122.1 hypothetical protein B0I36DRAFT_88440 [Microdochium trichocladiopsis]
MGIHLMVYYSQCTRGHGSHASLLPSRFICAANDNRPRRIRFCMPSCVRLPSASATLLQHASSHDNPTRLGAGILSCRPLGRCRRRRRRCRRLGAQLSNHNARCAAPVLPTRPLSPAGAPQITPCLSAGPRGRSTARVVILCAAPGTHHMISVPRAQHMAANSPIRLRLTAFQAHWSQTTACCPPFSRSNACVV